MVSAMDAARPRSLASRVTAKAVVVLALAVTTTLTACEPGAISAAATAGPGDGSSIDRAGASCWGIKQQYPTSTTGTYWLLTPAMDRPAAFYCDMTTSGGGWVLIGRGREGWTFQPTGQGSASQVRTAVSGSAAFSPATLDSETITGLINGAKVANLSDGVRLERMTNTAGTTKQDYRLYLRQAHWNWTFHAGQLLNKVVVNGKTYNGGNTYDTFEKAIADQSTNALAGAQSTNRMFTWAWDRNDKKAGFSYGKGAPTGSTSATTNLWQRSSSSYPIPFTRVWLRPKLANTVSFGPTPVGGFGAEPKPAGLKDRSELAPWGVTGMNHTDEQNVEPYNTNVLALETSATRVYVGGRFTGVRQGPSAAPQAQAALAAFDLDGTWISTFRPVVVGRVWDIALTPDNKLIIAGDFTSVNGVANTRGLAALDPTTGAVLAGWKARVSRVGGTEWRVRTIDVRDGWIYAGGLFDRVVPGTETVPRAVSNAMAVSVADGSIGPWKPTPNGSVIDLAVTTDATRVLLAGNFGAVGGSTTHAFFAVTNLATGAPTAGTGAWQPSGGSDSKTRYQQAVADLGDRLLVGGSQHDLQLWNRTRSTLLDSSIAKPGGDSQVIEVVGSKTYMGCHCGGWTYLGTNNWLHPSGFRAIEPIGLIGAWDTATWTYDTTWYPGSLRGASGEGIWAIDQDVRGCLWVGGDLNRGAFSGVAATDYLGGFARFCPMDVTVPSAPAPVSLASNGASRKITWGASTDPDGDAPSYDVIRNGKVIATVSAATRTYTDPDAPAGTTYAVRATDERGNRSASAAPLVAG